MEVLVSPPAHKQNSQVTARKCPSGGSHKDLWIVVRDGSLTDVESALAFLKKNGGNINSRNTFGLTPLHIATWRNHIPIVRRLLDAGADPDARDGESGWSSLHRALHFGHLAVASILLQSGASIALEDTKFRTSIDLLSGPVNQVIGNEHNSVSTEVLSWGSGTNYQLGTGNAHIQKLPCKVDSLHGYLIKLISAAKFHSVAVSAHGEVYTWGFGRGGRLGHPDFDIHSGQAAVITPRQVTSGLGSRCVKAIAAAKHHTVIATEGGEVFTWGSNREGQLGYTSVDTQSTPRRVSLLRSKIIAVAAANKHTAAVSELGEVFTWGCNREGQLGYGTSNSASNYTPRVVEYLKGKVFKGVSAAKYHTIVLGVDGEVYTWGHRLVTPKRVVVARNLKKTGSIPLKFHHDGALFYWVSSDPDIRSQQLYMMCGINMVSISAGKYWTAAVTATGDVYIWDGKKGKDKPPVVTRLPGVKRATSVSVGETHILIVGSLYHPVYASHTSEKSQKLMSNTRDEMEEFNEDLIFNDREFNDILPIEQKVTAGQRSIPSLKSLCEKVAADSLVEPRNALQMLEIADSLEADDLRKHCEEIVIRNLDYIFMMSSHAITSASLDILANLERLLDQRSSEPWSHRRFPTPTATFPAIIDSEEEDSDREFQRTHDKYKKISALKSAIGQRLESFLQPKDDPNQGISKHVRALRKKLQQIEMLEAKQSNGHLLDDQQIAKLETKSALESSLEELSVAVETSQDKASFSVFPGGKGNKKGEPSKKQRRKNKTRGAQVEVESSFSGLEVITDNVKDFSDTEILGVSKIKEKDALELHRNKSSLQGFSKKKSKKGGLSMFLSGALDNAPKQVAPPPPMPKNEGPAWGGTKILKSSASLREIQDEQSKIQGKHTTRSRDQVEDPLDCRSGVKIQLSSLLSSNPIPVASTHTAQASDGDKSTPPWAASGTPPLLSRPSLRNIQMQQQGKQHQSISHSPKTRTAGFSITTTGQGSPSDSAGVNKWFKPEVETPSSIRSIQIEEKAMKDLKRFYSSVKIVKNQS
ncbi:ankyrin repeat family protein / regulator of chromosome condensation (RCC1) family protein [Quillaja saponaria]|uniref:Ankyrin repeat family protein / regulator of chromosome condensation (RCC1) family protein n=1 Tax=Quillaja saponaria TaxID=32244 RepID=A0AAD7VDL2_QUISA|nr:ankyrin repeat family protein / regulator of chromosome condensation (RCC1) family protein [Quillaja saponaria]